MLSNFWLPDSAVSAFESGEATEIHLSMLKNGLSDFVKIGAGKNVPINFKTDGASTDGETINLSATHLSDPDVATGLALHEASHVRLTDFDVLQQANDLVLALSNNTQSLASDRPWLSKFGNEASEARRHDNNRFVIHMIRGFVGRLFPMFEFLCAAPRCGFCSGEGCNMAQLHEFVGDGDSAEHEDQWPVRHYDDGLPAGDNYIHVGKPVYAKPDNKRGKFDSRVGAEICRNCDCGFSPKPTKLGKKVVLDLHNTRREKALLGLVKTLFTLFNLVEDYRVDDVSKTNMPGYVGYYDAIEEKFWDETKYAEGCDTRSPALFMRMMLGVRRSDVKSHMMPGLGRAETMLSKAAISKLSDSQDSMRVARSLLLLMIEHYDVSAIFKAAAESAEPENPAGPDGAVSPQDFDASVFDAVDQHTSPYRSFGDSVNKDVEAAVDAYQGNRITETGDSSETFNTVTMAPADFQRLPGSEKWETKFDGGSFEDGIKIGRSIAGSISFLDQPQTTNRISGLNDGTLDSRELHMIHSFDNVFCHKTKENQNSNVNLFVTIDASSSMKGKKEREAKKLAGIFVGISNLVSSFNVKIGFRIFKDNPIHVVVENPEKGDDVSKFNSSGYTPTGHVFEHMLKARQLEDVDYLVNISDGEPQIPSSSYGGESAILHTKKQVQRINRTSTELLSYFAEEENIFGNGEKAFRKIYGNKGRVVNVQDLGTIKKTIIDLIRSNPQYQK